MTTRSQAAMVDQVREVSEDLGRGVMEEWVRAAIEKAVQELSREPEERLDRAQMVSEERELGEEVTNGREGVEVEEEVTGSQAAMVDQVREVSEDLGRGVMGEWVRAAIEKAVQELSREPEEKLELGEEGTNGREGVEVEEEVKETMKKVKNGKNQEREKRKKECVDEVGKKKKRNRKIKSEIQVTMRGEDSEVEAGEVDELEEEEVREKMKKVKNERNKENEKRKEECVDEDGEEKIKDKKIKSEIHETVRGEDSEVEAGEVEELEVEEKVKETMMKVKRIRKVGGVKEPKESPQRAAEGRLEWGKVVGQLAEEEKPLESPERQASEAESLHVVYGMWNWTQARKFVTKSDEEILMDKERFYHPVRKKRAWRDSTQSSRSIG